MNSTLNRRPDETVVDYLWRLHARHDELEVGARRADDLQNQLAAARAEVAECEAAGLRLQELTALLDRHTLGEVTEVAATEPPEINPPAGLPEAKPDADPSPRSHLELLRVWIAARDPEETFTAPQAAQEAGIPAGSVGTYITQLTREGAVFRDPAPRRVGVPVPLRRTPWPEPSAEPQHVAAPQPRGLSPLKAVRAAVATLARDLPPLKASGGEASPAQCEQVLTTLQRHGRPMSANLMLARLHGQGIKFTVLLDALGQLTAQGRVAQTPDRLYAAAEASP